MKPHEIKFKAKIKGQKELCTVLGINMFDSTIDIQCIDSAWQNQIFFEDVEELLQWTGFYDKKDNSIYENDIINIDGDLHLVQFHKGEIILPFYPLDYTNEEQFQTEEKENEEQFINEKLNQYSKYIDCIIKNQPPYHYNGFSDNIPWVYESSRIFEVVGNVYEEDKK